MTTRPEIRRYDFEIDGKTYKAERNSRTSVDVYLDGRLMATVSLPVPYHDLPITKILDDRAGHFRTNVRKALKLPGTNGNGHRNGRVR
jgi:hypothetical protein